MARVPRRWIKGVSLCAYCGVNVGTTSDHVIPKNLFVVKDQQMLTVPACEPCQLAKGLGERDLRLYCNAEIGGSLHEDAPEQIRRIVEGHEATREWLREAMADAKEVILVDESGTEVDRAIEIDFNPDRMIETLKFIVKGFYWIDRGEPLPPDSPIDVTAVPWSAFPDFLKRLAPHQKGEPVVKGNLAAWYSQINLDTSDPHSTAWVLCVNDGVAFYGATGTAAEVSLQGKEARAANVHSEPQPGPRRVKVPRTPDGRLALPPKE